MNKVDILANGDEVEEVVRFVRSGASRLLGVEGTQVLPVSARTALEAKMAAGGGQMAGKKMSQPTITIFIICAGAAGRRVHCAGSQGGGWRRPVDRLEALTLQLISTLRYAQMSHLLPSQASMPVCASRIAGGKGSWQPNTDVSLKDSPCTHSGT